jgi:hypothetical protein
MVALFGTFVFLCAILKLRDAKEAKKLDGAPKIVLLFAYSTLLIGLMFDIALNFILSIILLDPPALTGDRYQIEWLTTTHISRLKKSGNDWQKSVSNWLCKQLDRLDNKHCG